MIRLETPSVLALKGIEGNCRGKIYFWDHEKEPDYDECDGGVETAENVRLLSNTFVDFVSGLQPNPYQK